MMSMPKYDEQADLNSTVARVMSRFSEAKADIVSASPDKEANVNAAQASDGSIESESCEGVEGDSERWPLPGLAPMTRVRTSFGDVHAVALRKGDLVRTRNGQFKQIVWLNRVMLDESFLSEKPDSNPIRIQPGAVAKGVPTSEVMVSPRQLICAGPAASASMRREAADLMARPGVTRHRETGLSYTMFHLGEPAEVQCDGVYMVFEPPHA